MRFTTEAASLNTCNKHFIVTKTRYTKKKNQRALFETSSITTWQLRCYTQHTADGVSGTLVAFVAILAGFMCLMGLY